MKRSGRRRAHAARLVLGLLAAACLLGAGAASLWAADGPRYTAWSEPVNVGAGVNTTGTEQGPALSSDGLSLYFHRRPGVDVNGDDLWVAHRDSVGGAWGAAVNLGPTVNSSARDYAPKLSKDSHWLFFSSLRPGFGMADLWVSWRPDVHDDFGWQAPVNLGPNVNSASNDHQAGGLFEDGRGGKPQLYFASDRPGGAGGNDIYVSERNPDGSWEPARRIPELSSADAEATPNVRDDGLEIFFHRGNPIDLWVATRETLDAPWSTPVNLGPPINTGGSELHPDLNRRGDTLYFASNRPGGLGGLDIYTSTRSAILTVTARDQSRLFGQANPQLTYELSGFVAGETSHVVSGTASCSTTATPSSPAGSYPITCTAGSLTAPGYVFETFVAGTLTVSHSRPCLTGPSAGPLRVAAGEAVCIGAGGSQTGPVTVAPGGSLDVEGGRITGPVVANGAGAVRICGATIVGPLTVSGSVGPVVVGGEGCDPNTIVGPVRITDNGGGVEVVGNHVTGPLRVTDNAAPVRASGNEVTGPVILQP